MNENWTDAERLAAEVLASGSDEALRDLLAELDRSPPLGHSGRSGRARRSRSSSPALSWLSGRWRDSGLLNSIVDAAVIAGAIASIIIGTRPLLTAVYDARPAVAEALEGITIPSVPNLEPVDATATITAADRPVTSGEPISMLARNLEATVGRYRSVAAVYADRKLPCSQLRSSYSEVEDTWIRYSVARGRSYGDRLPESLVRWDEALYEAVQDVDRDFTASGCSRL